MNLAQLGLMLTTPRGGAGIPTGVPALTVAPSISGYRTQGQTLTGNHGTYTNFPTSYTYVWKRAGVAISGATSQTYLLTGTDVGTAITFCETPSNVAFGAGSQSTSASVTPAATLVITGTPGTTGNVGGSYTDTPGVTGGQQTGVTNGWSISGSVGASGLSFSTATGVLSATTLGAAATYGPFQRSYTDADGLTVPQSAFSVVVSAAATTQNYLAPYNGAGSYQDGGASTPFYAATRFSTRYNASRDQTYVCYEGNFGEARLAMMTRYNHADGSITAPVVVGRGGLQNDDHGVPGDDFDPNGVHHVFFGDHNQGVLSWSQETSAGSGIYQLNASLTAYKYAYPHIQRVGAGMYLFARHDPNNASYFQLILQQDTTNSGTFDAGYVVLDMGADSRPYQGGMYLDPVDTDLLWKVYTRADFADNARKGIYLVGHRISNGDLVNWGASHTFAKASGSLGLTELNTYYRLYDHGSQDGQVPGFIFDASGYPCFGFLVSNGSSWDVNTLEWNGSAFVQTFIETIPDRVSVAIYRNATNLSLEYMKTDRVVKRTRSALGTWSASSDVLVQPRAGPGAPPGTNPLNPNLPLNVTETAYPAHANGRVTYSETTNAASGERSDLRIYLAGDSGVLTRPVRTLWNPGDLGAKIGRWIEQDLFNTGKQWPDKRIGRTLGQNGAGNQPTKSTTGWNGGPTGLFTAASTQSLQSGIISDVPTGAASSEAWVLCKPTTGAVRTAVAWGSAGAGQYRSVEYSSTGLPTIRDNSSSYADTTPVTTEHVRRDVWDATGASGAGTWAGYTNGVAWAGSGAARPGGLWNTATSGKFALGAMCRTSPSLYFDGPIPFVLIVVGLLTTDEADRLYSWLHFNYGTPLPAGNPYTSAPTI